MCHLLMQVHFLVQSVERIISKKTILQEPMQLGGCFSSFHTTATINAFLMNQAIIISCSIFDEYNQEFTASKHPPFASRIHHFKLQIKPVTKRINQWKDLKSFRNHILAHNLRVQNDSIFGHANKSVHYNVPGTISEIKLLCELLSLITQNIGAEFPELEQQIDYNATILDKLTLSSKTIDFESEFKAISEQIKVLGLTRTQQTDLST